MMTSRLALLVAFSGLAGLAAPSALADDPVADILTCRTVEPVQARLACFDSAADRLAQASESGEFIAVTREDVEAVEGESFGFSLPSLPQMHFPLLAGRAEANRRASETLVSAPDAGEQTSDADVELAQATTSGSGEAPANAQAQPSAAAESPPPSVQILDRNDDGSVTRVLIPIVRTRVVGYGTMIFYLEGGQVWRQQDSRAVRLPRDTENMTAEIRTGALSNYWLRINGEGRAIAVHRQE